MKWFSTMLVSAAKWLGTLATILGVAFVAFQYFDGKWKSRIERSLEYTILYQEPEKVAARINVELKPPEEQRDNPAEPTDSAASIVGVVERDIDRAKIFPGLPFELRKEYVKRDLINHCKIYIDQFADKIVMLDDVVKKPNGVKRLSDLSVGQEIEFKDGEKVTKYAELWWCEHADVRDDGRNEVCYHYSTPSIMWKFFSQQRSEEVNFGKLDEYKLKACSRSLEEYQTVLSEESSRILRSLHELKHFYAALSICTTSGLCDSFVACEAFDIEVGTFLRDWEHYFELWSAREARTEYERLHQFVMHCRSNGEFLDRVENGVSRMLYIQQFTNYCWSSDEQGDGLCRALRWIAEIGTDSN